MGLLSDFLLVPAGTIDLSRLLQHPEQALSRVQARRIDPMQLENLVRVITDTNLDIHSPLAMSEDGERFLLAIPESLSVALAAAQAADRQRWATRWNELWEGLQTQQERNEHRERLAALLEALVPLAKRVAARKAQLLLWCSL